MKPLALSLAVLSLYAVPARAADPQWEKLKEAIARCGRLGDWGAPSLPEKALVWTSDEIDAGPRPREITPERQAAMDKARERMTGILGGSASAGAAADPAPAAIPAPAPAAKGKDPNRYTITENAVFSGEKAADGTIQPKNFYLRSVQNFPGRGGYSRTWTWSVSADGSLVHVDHSSSRPGPGDSPRLGDDQDLPKDNAAELLRDRIAWWNRALQADCSLKPAAYPAPDYGASPSRSGPPPTGLRNIPQ